MFSRMQAAGVILVGGVIAASMAFLTPGAHGNDITLNADCVGGEEVLTPPAALCAGHQDCQPGGAPTCSGSSCADFISANCRFVPTHLCAKEGDLNIHVSTWTCYGPIECERDEFSGYTCWFTVSSEADCVWGAGNICR